MADAVRLWDTETGEEALTLKGGTKEVNGAAFSPRGDKPRAMGRRLAAGCTDGVVRIWDAGPTE
jgi:WD40 repeat protein